MELGTAGISWILLAATWVILGGVFYYTRLRPVLVNLVWFIVSYLITGAWLRANVSHEAWFHHEIIYFYLWEIVDKVMMAGTYVWMILSLVRWGHPNLPLSWRRPSLDDTPLDTTSII